MYGNLHLSYKRYIKKGVNITLKKIGKVDTWLAIICFKAIQRVWGGKLVAFKALNEDLNHKNLKVIQY